MMTNAVKRSDENRLKIWQKYIHLQEYTKKKVSRKYIKLNKLYIIIIIILVIFFFESAFKSLNKKVIL